MHCILFCNRIVRSVLFFAFHTLSSISMFHPCHLLLHFPISHSFIFGRPSLSCCDIHAMPSSPSTIIHALFPVRPFTLYFFSTLSTTGNSSRQLAVAYRELSHVIMVFRKAAFLHLYCCHMFQSLPTSLSNMESVTHSIRQHALYIELKIMTLIVHYKPASYRFVPGSPPTLKSQKPSSSVVGNAQFPPVNTPMSTGPTAKLQYHQRSKALVSHVIVH